MAIIRSSPTLNWDVSKKPGHGQECTETTGPQNSDKPTTGAMTPTPKVHNKYHNIAPSDAVYIGRGSPWGNPYQIGVHGDRAKVIDLYKKFVLPSLDVSALKGKDLVCFCKPQACHGDLLLEKANGDL